MGEMFVGVLEQLSGVYVQIPTQDYNSPRVAVMI